MEPRAPPDPILLSSLNDYLYCPRRCALHRLEQLWEANAHTVGGDLAHQTADDPGYRLSAAGARIERALPLFSLHLNLIGKADIVEFWPNPAKQEHSERNLEETATFDDKISRCPSEKNSHNHETPLPIDYKLGPRRKWDNDDVQLCAQALCLEEMFATPVPTGAVYHVKTHRRRIVEFTPQLRQLALDTIAAVANLYVTNQVPPAVLRPQCQGCSLHGLCLPELTASASSLNAAHAALFSPKECPMDEVQLNTLYVVTEGAYLHREGQAILIEVEKVIAARVPLHMIDSIACFGRVMVSPSLLEACAESHIAVSFLNASGRLMARVDAPGSGNVLLRRRQFRMADDPAFCLNVAKSIVAGKIQNARHNLLRSARDISDPIHTDPLRRTADLLACNLDAVAAASTLDSLRGQEGDAAKCYFSVFSHMLPDAPPEFRFAGRSRQPPLDPINALLSLVYSILTHDCTAALATAGLDPSVGFFHQDRPGRPSLSLDLVEEFRAPLADRFVITLINRKQLSPNDFVIRLGGAVELTEPGRKRLIAAFQQRKMETRTHPYLQQEVPLGRFPSLQARILARHLRSDLAHYVPVIFK